MALRFLIIFTVFVFASVAQELFPVNIIHVNDMHARFDESNIDANMCRPEDTNCIGGYARAVTKVKELKLVNADKNPIYLNAADYYQGTLWYNLFRWNVTSHFLNLYPADAMTIGNHEFDDGIAGLVPLMEASKSPILISNIDDSLEPTFQNTYNKSMVITKYGRPIGIVGVTTTFPSGWGNVNVLPEIEAVRAEVDKLTADGVNIIIVLSHCGLKVDREIAKLGGAIDLIVGGHSHSFLFSGLEPPGPDNPVSDYPTIEVQENGDKVLIVQASAYNKYVGDITLYFDEEGKVQKHEGAPIFLSHDIEKDPEIAMELEPWKKEVDIVQNRLVGYSKFEFSRHRCYVEECLMGMLLTDAFAYAFLNINPENIGWTGATIALNVPGGIRGGLMMGTIYYGHLATTTPFENMLYSIELQGKVIKEALEFSVAKEDDWILLQSSGLKIVYDVKRELNNRIVSLDVLCRVCVYDIPRYEPVVDENYYRVVMPDFLARGGDGFTMIRDNARNMVMGPADIDALNDYVEKNTPFNKPPMAGRVTFL